MVVLVHIYASVHRITYRCMTNHCVCISPIIDVTNDDPRIGFINADIGEQRLAVFDPNPSDHGIGGAGTIVHGDTLNQST